MAQPTSPLDPEAVFQSTLLDASGQPDLIIDSAQSHELIWTLVNNATGAGQDLVVTPFTSGPVGPNQYHFLFGFAPGALTDPPTLQGWDVAIQKDVGGGITSLYIALSGNTPLRIPPGGDHKATLTYTNAIQEDSNRSKVAVTLTAGRQVTLAGTPVPGKSYGPFDLMLVQANTPTLSAPPLTVDLVGRRTVLNDGQTPNSFTFALTNMTQADLPLTPKVGGADASPTIFTVWFDAAPNQPAQPYPWALAKVEDLASEAVVLTVPSDWTASKPPAEPEVIAGNPQWEITVSKVVVLGPQDPVFFKFTGIRTDLDPGVTRMYLRYESLPGFHDGVLIGELEKTPLLYGVTRGQGLYLSAGTPQGNTPPALHYDSGLYVQQFDDVPAATFDSLNSVGTGVQITNRSAGGKTWQFISSGAKTPAGTGKLLIQESSGTPPVATFQSDGNVGIGTPGPNAKLEIDLDDKDITTNPFMVGKGATNYLTILNTGNVGIGTTTPPAAKLEVAGKGGADIDLIVSGRIQSNSSSGGLWLSDKRDGFVGNNGSSVGFWVPSIGFNALQIEKTTGNVSISGNVGIGKMTAPQASLDVQGEIKSTTLTIGNDALLVKDGKVTVNRLQFVSQSLIEIGDSKDLVFQYSDKTVAMFNRDLSCWFQGPVSTGSGFFSAGPILLYDPGENAWRRLCFAQESGYAWATLVPHPIPSDLRFKSEMQLVPSALDKIRRLCGVSFRWNEDALQRFTRDIETTISAGPNATERENQEVWQAERDRRRNQLATTHIGIVAQDVEAVLPEAVTTDADGYKSVRYDNLIPLLIEAIKEQDQIAAQQQAEIERLKHALLMDDPQR